MTGFTSTDFSRQQALAMHLTDSASAADDDYSFFCAKSKHGGMAMYMDGFHFTLRNLSHDSTKPLSCLNMFTSSWTLSTPWRFYFAMLVVTVLGISIEALTTFKLKLAAETTINSSYDKNRLFQASQRMKRLFTTLLNFIQALIR